MRQKLISYFKENRLPGLSDSVFEKLVTGPLFLRNAEIEIDYEKRLVRLEYSLPLDIEEDLWIVTKGAGKEFQGSEGWYDSIYPHKAIFKLLREIVGVIYIKVSKKNRWAPNIREKRGTPINKDNARTLYVQWRSAKEKDLEGELVKTIVAEDIPAYKTFIRKKMLSEINPELDNEAKDRERKKLKKRVDQKINKRIIEIQKSKLQKAYIERLKKAGLIDEDCRLLVDNQKFISRFKKLSKKFARNEKPVYKTCASCGERYEVLTNQPERKWCYKPKCRQREYRIRKITAR